MKYLLVCVVVFLSSCCLLHDSVTRVPVSSEYAGELELGSATLNDGYIIIETSFRNGGWIQNSGQIPCNLWSRLEGNKILITVSSCLATKCVGKQEIKIPLTASRGYEIVYVESNGDHTKLQRYDLGI